MEWYSNRTKGVVIAVWYVRRCHRNLMVTFDKINLGKNCASCKIGVKIQY
jgi:hypothetical protein